MVLGETGNPVPLVTTLYELPNVGYVRAAHGYLKLGELTLLRFRTTTPAIRVSLGGMMIPTNKAFLALNGVNVGRWSCAGEKS